MVNQKVEISLLDLDKKTKDLYVAVLKNYSLFRRFVGALIKKIV